MPNSPMSNAAIGVELAARLDTLLRKLLTGKKKRPHGWAVRSEHVQTYGYLSALFEKLQVALGITPLAMPDEYEPGAGNQLTDEGVMLLAQQIALILDLAPGGHPIQSAGDIQQARSLLESVSDSLKA